MRRGPSLTTNDAPPRTCRPSKPCGGPMLIEAESEDAVRAIVAADPFEIGGLSATIEIRPFR